MKNVKRNTLLTYLSGSYKTETKVNLDRIYELNNMPEKSGDTVYLCERELRYEDNFGINFAFEKSNEIIILYTPHQLKNLNVGTLIVDFNPIKDYSYLNQFGCKIYEVDSHNIIPARIVSNKQEYSAGTFRRKVYSQINRYLTDYPFKPIKNKYARKVLDNFIQDKLDYYAEFKNDPTKAMTSNLSIYLNKGFISSQRVVLEILKSNTNEENIEEFLEEIIIRKELADNYCLYNKNYKSIKGIPNWAKSTLIKHTEDFREYVYTKEEFEQAKTHDKLWNATQHQLIKNGYIHGYLRMYWAKKILEWTKNPQQALDIAIYLNDKYGLDAPSPNGYVGILWAIGGLHDRAFRDSNITGQIRKMTYKGIKSKYNVEEYILNYI